MSIASYKDLDVWKIARVLVKEAYEITASFPDTERYGIISQIRRAAVSIPANIAEGNARAFRKEYIHFVSIAFGSAAELETLFLLALDLAYVKQEKFEIVMDKIDRVSRMLNKLIQSLKASA